MEGGFPFSGEAAALCRGRRAGKKCMTWVGGDLDLGTGQVDFTCFDCCFFLFPVSSCSLGGNHRGRSLFPFPDRCRASVMFPVTGLASDGEDSAPLRSPCGLPFSDTMSLPPCSRRSVM